jgi:hypothetical protein
MLDQENFLEKEYPDLTDELTQIKNAIVDSAELHGVRLTHRRYGELPTAPDHLLPRHNGSLGKDIR